MSGYDIDSQENFRCQFYDPDSGYWFKIDEVLSFSRTRPKGATDVVNIIEINTNGVGSWEETNNNSKKEVVKKWKKMRIWDEK